MENTAPHDPALRQAESISNATAAMAAAEDAAPPLPAPRRNPIALHIPFRTFLAIAAFALAIYLICHLSSLLLLVFLAVFLGVVLHAMVVWLDRKRLPHALSMALVVGGLCALTGAALWLMMPLLMHQLTNIGPAFEELQKSTINRLPEDHVLRQAVQRLISGFQNGDEQTMVNHFVAAGQAIANGCSTFIIWLVLGVYLLVDGVKIYHWFLAFFQPKTRLKLRQTVSEISNVIFHYALGQGLTSLFVTVTSYIGLLSLHVPGALTLAILAGLLDILPVLGFMLSIVPAVLLALTVSPQTALYVAVIYLVIQCIENYWLIPAVYGRHLRLSTLTVLVGLLAGGMLAGIQGAIVVLPILASYTVIERLWLAPYMNKGVVEKHEEQKKQEFGEPERVS